MGVSRKSATSPAYQKTGIEWSNLRDRLSLAEKNWIRERLYHCERLKCILCLFSVRSLIVKIGFFLPPSRTWKFICLPSSSPGRSIHKSTHRAFASQNKFWLSTCFLVSSERWFVNFPSMCHNKIREFVLMLGANFLAFSRRNVLQFGVSGLIRR